jgi:hypothetical protein
VRAAIEMCGADPLMFGSDYGPVPYGIEEHIRIVEDVLPQKNGVSSEWHCNKN